MTVITEVTAYEMEEKTLVCEDCGTTEGVDATTCPYAEEIHGTYEEATLCGACYRERCMDI